MTHEASETPLATESTGDRPVVEFVGQTRHEEARIAVATAAGLLEDGVSPSDIVITAVDLDPYEDLLERAAKRYGLTLAVWTPLNLKRTCPYQFAASLLGVLRERSEGPLDIETLGEPLRLGWASPQSRSLDGPLPTDHAERLIDQYHGTTLTITDWKRQIAEGDIESQYKRHVIGYLNWLGAQPQQPSPDAVSDAIGGAMDAYENAVLPSEVGDEPVSELAETLRGFDRTVTLLKTAQQRYSKWLDYGRTERSWGVVEELLDAFATTLPGRRELPTAAAIDVKEANDMWALEVPYVIAVGVVDTEWPRSIDSAVPSVSRAAISQQENSHNSGVRPHSSWTTARDHDHFVSAAAAASDLFVVTRFATDADGVEQQPSRFLDDLEPTHISDGVADLIGDPSMLPETIAESVRLEAQQ